MGRYLGPLMRAKLGRAQNTRGWGWWRVRRAEKKIPTTPTLGHFLLSLVSLASRDQDGGPVELNDRNLRSHGKIGDCTQSI